MKKTAKDFIDDLLSDRLNPQLKQLLLSCQQNEATALLAEYYEYEVNDFELALMDAKPKLEAALGCDLTDEQLIAIAGGKLSKGDAIFVGVSSGAAGATAADCGWSGDRNPR